MRGRIVILLTVVAALGVVVCQSTAAISNLKLSEFAQNDILFYDPSESSCSSGSGGCVTVSGDLPAETVAALESAGVKEKAEANMERYKYAEEQTGIYWQAIAALHYREAGMDPAKSISNGSPLTTDGSCYANADGVQVCGSANEDAKEAAQHFISLAGYFSDEGDPSSSNATLADYAAAFATYKGGEIYQCNNKRYLDTTYVMNGLDEDHMNMTWQEYDVVRYDNPAHSYCTYKVYVNNPSAWIGHQDNIGALAVFVYLGGNERIENGGNDLCGSGVGSGGTASVGSGNPIAEKAKELSWGVNERPSQYVGNDAYNEAAKALGGDFIQAGRDDESGCRISESTGICYSCARFVSLVIYESEADADFNAETKASGNRPHMIGESQGYLTYYLANSDNWEMVEDYSGVGYDGLQPGDVLIRDIDFDWANDSKAQPSESITSMGGFPYHTFVYVGDGIVAEGSNSTDAPYRHEWVSGANDGYVAFRLKNGGTTSSGEYCRSSKVSGEFANNILMYAWPEWSATRKDARPEYQDLVNSGKYYNGGGPTDCNGFVTKMIIINGIDANYNSESWKQCAGTLQAITNGVGFGAGWETLYSPGDAIDTSRLTPGDVFLNSHHTFLFVGEIDGFQCDLASASLNDHVPVACQGENVNAEWYSGGEYYVFRKK